MVTLKTVLRLNASTCVGFGLLFISLPNTVSQFLSLDNSAPEWVLSILGVGLISQGLHLIWASYQKKPNKGLILYFSMGDFVWVLASLVLMTCQLWISSPMGIVSSSLVAIVVGVLGVMQLQSYKYEHCAYTTKKGTA